MPSHLFHGYEFDSTVSCGSVVIFLYIVGACISITRVLHKSLFKRSLTHVLYEYIYGYECLCAHSIRLSKCQCGSFDRFQVCNRIQ